MAELLSRDVLISLHSDDPAQFGSGWLTQTLTEAQRAADFSQRIMSAFMRNSFVSAWVPSDEKRRYLDKFDEAHLQLEHTGIAWWVEVTDGQSIYAEQVVPE